MKPQPWIYSLKVDNLFVLSPPFLSLLIILLFPAFFAAQEGIPAFWWVILIVCIDVAHVYSTLFRTYFEKETFRKQRNMLIGIPVVGFVISVILYTIDGMLFWRILAYLAVFHFIRQQYGFMRIYSRKEPFDKCFFRIDQVTIYTGTIYPVLYWHLSTPRNFHWFIDGDFWRFEFKGLLMMATMLYTFVIVVYVVKEIVFIKREKSFNWPRNAVIVGTFLSWYFGIVYFNGDLAFTLLNVVSHGIPYMALIWVYGRKKGEPSYGKLTRKVFTEYGAVLFVLSMIVLAYIEEGFWDAWIWKEHPQVFSLFYPMAMEPGNDVLALLVPLLALPQITHYIIDGYIWKVSRGHVS